MTSFYSEKELSEIGFKSVGRDVRLSRKASIYTPERISIGDHVRIDDFCILSGKISIGRYIHIGAYSGLFGGELITMEDFSGLSSRVSIYTISEDYLGEGLTNPTVPDKYRHPHSGPVTLGKHSIIGAGSIVLPGVTIGEGVAVGALSLVLGSLPPWMVCSGSPARPRTARRQDLIQRYEAELAAEEKN